MSNLIILFIKLLILSQIISIIPTSTADLFELSIIHFNDFHARYEQTSWKGGTCKKKLADEKKCVGGIARMLTKSNDLLKRKNAILLCAGDLYTGTLWHTAHKSKIVTSLFNLLPIDAAVLGNHEFDDGIAGILPYIENSKADIVVANMDVSREPRMEGKLKPSKVIERGGVKIGIVGYMDQTTNTFAHTEKVTFFDEIKSVNKAAAEMKKDGVNIIICLSHAGINIDVKVAEHCPDVDVIVGGHSHTLLYTGTPPGGDTSLGPYPTVVTQKSGRRVPVVQAGSFSKYLGFISVKFDGNGEVVSWSGNPILLDHKVVEDPAMLEAMKPFREEIEKYSLVEVGSVIVNMEDVPCKSEECNLGNLIADSMVFDQTNRKVLGKSWTHASIAFIQAGGIRSSLDEQSLNGVLTYGDIASVLPFRASCDIVELQGKHILEVLEYSVAVDDKVEGTAFFSKHFLQMSGLRVAYNLSQPSGNRVVPGVSVMCSECRVPKFEPLDPDKSYRVITTDFLIGGGDGYDVIKDNFKNRELGNVDIDILQDYVKTRRPIYQGVDGRIKMITDQNTTSTSPSLLSNSCWSITSTTLLVILHTARF